MQVIADDTNATSNYCVMNELINNNDKNLVHGIEEMSCNNIIYDQSKDDCLETNLKDINLGMDTNISLTTKDSDDTLKDVEPDVTASRNDKFDSSLNNILELNNVAEPIHNSQHSSTSDNENKAVKLTKRKYCRIVDSDSEDDDINSVSRKKMNVTDADNESVISNESLKINNAMKNKNKIRIMASDSENESQHSEKETVNSDSENDDISNSLARSNRNVIEDDTKSVISNESLKISNSVKNQNKTRIMESDSEDESEQTREKQKFKNEAVKRFETLVDSESDEDEINQTESPLEEDTECTNFQNSNKKMTKSQGRKKESNKQGSIRSSKVEAMRQIHSETQRLIRESEISLPYHRPKQRTLQEFLNRKHLSITVPKAPTIASRLKMSTAIISKLLDDKAKEAEEFYKSSESEEEEEKVEKEANHISEPTIDDTDASYIENKTPSNGIGNDVSETTDKLVNDTHKNEDVSRNETFSNNVSRRLFNENANAGTEDLNNLHCLSMANDKIEKTDISSKETVQDRVETLNKIIINHDHSKNDELDVQETVDMLLQSVEHVIQTNDIDELNFDSITSEIHSEDTSRKIPEETSENIEKQVLHTATKDDQQNINMSVSERGPQETMNSVQGLPLPDFIVKEQESSKKRALPVIKSIIKSTIQPRLSGHPGMTIDLSCDKKPNKAGVENLINRFFSKHTAQNKDVERETEINVIHLEQTFDGPKVVKQTLLHKQPVLGKEDPELKKPGAKLKRLQEDLKLKMALKRNEEWKQKEQELKEQEDELKEDDLYDICNEEKLYDETSESGESEPEENDIPMVDKGYKNTCEFADDEAEESEDENEENDQLNDENEEEEEEEEENEEDEEKERNCRKDQIYDNDNDESSMDSVTVKKKWKPKRIIKAFEDDSNLSPSKISIDDVNESKKNAFERTTTDIDLFETDNDNCQSGWNSDEECNVSVFQKNKQADTMAQICKTPSIKTSVLDFISPITQLTILRTNSDKKDSAKKDEFMFVGSTDSFSQMGTPFDKMPRSACDPDKRIGLQKKLFDDFNNVTNDEDLMELCSGTFPSTQMNDLNFTPSRQTSSLDMDNTFPSTQVNDSNPTPSRQTSSLDTVNTQMLDVNKLGKDILLENDTSQDIKLFLEENLPALTESKAKTAENTSTGVSCSKLVVDLSSDNEDDFSNTNKVNFARKRRVKILELSDEEDESANDILSDEEEADEYVDYDSEENEIVASKKSIKKVTSEFFENEAELSESDWDSADEDEKDLDKLEAEEGDEDDIDENKVRNQLEKIHMKQVLDQDQREVRMLQELLFEDGDLHSDGSGRQRKFKWKNIDKLGENNDAPRIDDDVNAGLDLQETENELEWYKLRHEREKFLQEKKRSLEVEIEENLEKSEIFKVGVKVMKRMESMQSEKQDSSQSQNESIEPIMPRHLSDLLNTRTLGGKTSAVHTRIKKCSFLSRGEEELNRIAKRLRLNDTVKLAPVNTKNFVFAHVSPVVKNDDDEESENIHGEEKKELEDKTFGRKKRKATTSMTPKTTKRVKQEGSNTKKKKLFG